MFWTLWKDLKRFQNQSRKGQGIEKLKKDLLSHCMQMPKVILNLGLNLEFVFWRYLRRCDGFVNVRNFTISFDYEALACNIHLYCESERLQLQNEVAL